MTHAHTPVVRLAIAVIGAVTLPAAAHAGITDFILYHTYDATQTASGLSPEAASLQAVGISSGATDFDGGTLTAPDSTVSPVSAENFTTFGYYRADPATHPFGVYTLALTNSVTHATGTISTNYTADYYPSSAPALSNYAASQHFDPTKTTTFDLVSGFTAPEGATAAGITFIVEDDTTLQRIIQLDEPASTTSFTVPANTATLGEKLDFYLEADVDQPYTDPGTGLPTTNEFRYITTGVINAAVTPGVPEPASWALMIAGFGAVGWSARRRQAGTVTA